MSNYCTLFDKHYLRFGLTLHASLLQSRADFCLYILAMDAVCHDALARLQLPHVVLLRVDDVLDRDYAHLRERMSFAQICWTSQPLLCRHVLDHCQAGSVTYLEADSYFYRDPEVLLQAVGDRSVSLVPHDYAQGMDQTAVAGVYCVQFNYFRDDATGRHFLNDWLENCLRYDKTRRRFLPGQKCMDGWPAQSPQVCVLHHKGAGVAPWNISERPITQTPGGLMAASEPLIFFHFHELAYFGADKIFLSSYPIAPDVQRLIYTPYIQALAATEKLLASKLPDFPYRKVLQVPGLVEVVKSLDWDKLRHYLRFALARVSGRFAANLLPV